MLEVNGLKVRYGEITVLDIEFLRIETGRVTAVTGPNGSGKTTLLTVIAGLIQPDSGSITWNGRPIAGLSGTPVRMLLQKPVLFSGTVFSNVEYGLKCMGIAGAERKQKANAVLSDLGILPLSTRNRRQISGGEAQRVALARILVLDPEVILLDEPFAFLDRSSAAKLTETICSFRGSRTVVFTTHDPVLPSILADRTVALAAGRPVSPEVMNIFTGESIRSNTRYYLKISDRLTIEHTVPSEGRLSLRLDPRAVVVSTRELESSSRNRILIRIRTIASDPPLIRITGDSDIPLQAVITEQSLHELGLQVGENAFFTFKATALDPVVFP